MFITKDGNLVLDEDQPINISFNVDPEATSGSFLIPTFEEQSCTTSDCTGTLHWMSPAPHAGTDYSFDADLWAVGLLIQDADGAAAVRWRRCVRHRQGSDRDFIRGLLTKDRHARTTLAQAKVHPYFSGVNWMAAAHHSGPATWAPRKAYVPAGPRKTPLTTGVPYQYGDDLPAFVFIKPGFFDPPPGPVKALIIKVTRIFKRKKQEGEDEAEGASGFSRAHPDQVSGQVGFLHDLFGPVGKSEDAPAPET
ncbi:Protein kinase domain-containing protein [Mycena sanguinolenta]|uniref:Protein kinase domain-containing protein n=1 Tax=Mycena sanguinolenta TaxID=230812 RepID=A0A8H6Z6D5_9AGAR|nr:Protein kinase domain-containing protein [Mycena sanguinolenta]